MAEADKIFVDASEGAAILHGDGSSVRSPTLQEAVIEFAKLDHVQQSKAKIRIASGREFNSEQIGRLHYK